MRMNWILSAAFVVMAISAAAGAQSSDGMEKKNDGMNMTYVGCVEAVNHGGTFMLKDVDMGMKSDAAMMKKERTPIVLAGSDLKKHVGQKVSINGSLSSGAMGTMRQDLSTLTVKTLKVIAKSCA
jgi:hypothetical protein